MKWKSKFSLPMILLFFCAAGIQFGMEKSLNFNGLLFFTVGMQYLRSEAVPAEGSGKEPQAEALRLPPMHSSALPVQALSVLEKVEVVLSGVRLDHVDCVSIIVGKVRESVEALGLVLAVALYDREVEVEERCVVLESRNVGR